MTIDKELKAWAKAHAEKNRHKYKGSISELANALLAQAKKDAEKQGADQGAADASSDSA